MKYKKVYIEWWDHASVPGWIHPHQLGGLNSDGECALRPILNKTFGWLVTEDESSVYISHTITEHNVCCDPIAILKNNITKRKNVK